MTEDRGGGPVSSQRSPPRTRPFTARRAASGCAPDRAYPVDNGISAREERRRIGGREHDGRSATGAGASPRARTKRP